MNKFALIPILLICINTNLPWLSSVNGFIHVHNTELVYTGQTYIGVKLIIQDCNGCVISNNTFTDYNGIASVALEIINSQNIIIGNNTFTRLNAFTNSETYAIKIINSVNVTIDQNVISEINNNVITNLVFLYNSSNILISDNLIENIISLKLNSFRIQESYNITLESNIILNTTTNYFINKISGTDKLLFINNSFNINSTNAECLYIQHSNNINFTLNNMVINQNEVMNMSFIGQSTNFRMNNNTISTDGDFSIGIIDQSENGLIELNQIITLNYTNYSLYNNKDVFISENNLDLNGELLNISKKVEILSYDPNMIFDFNIDSDSKRYNVTWFITNITGNFSIYF
ncbi:MAG: hypothetical protein OEY49_14845, partial [Candidatus Heimdallarchaeota archaeon]|nr:hypothetical protein [Candidatus Heimdallarchaeota archaeon]